MGRERDLEHRDEGAEPPSRPKSPYVKPAYRLEKVFETMALACGKISTTQGQCRLTLKNS